VKLFHEAWKVWVINKSPMKGIRIDRNPVKRDRIFWSKEEINQFLNIAEQERKNALYHFALDTGTRLGEILCLTWSDINFKEKTVTISKQMSIDGKPELIRSEMKGYYPLPLTSQLVEILLTHKEHQDAIKVELGDKYQQELDLVFPNRNGQFQHPSAVRRQLKVLIEKANVRFIQFADFRRIYANLLARCGVSSLTRERLLRYKSSIYTTIGCPYHLSFHQGVREAMIKLDKEIYEVNNPPIQ
jgi:integrase